jgi:uncharacterized membrane protein YeaQ/YmgE (transglycosylase-associated protein family)
MHHHGLIITIILGFIIGVIAKLLMPGRDPGGFIVTTLLGIVGSVFASMAGRALHLYRPGQPAGFIASVVGAMVLLALYHMITRRNAGV